jgi:hypothetical protein
VGCPCWVKPGLPPWGPHVRVRRVQTLVREGSPLVKLGNDRRPEQQKAPDRAKATRRQPPSFSGGETTAAAVAILPRLRTEGAYREAWVTHEPRCSRIGPSPRFTNIAAPSSSTEKLHVTTYHMLRSLFPDHSAGPGSQGRDYAGVPETTPAHATVTWRVNSGRSPLAWRLDQPGALDHLSREQRPPGASHRCKCSPVNNGNSGERAQDALVRIT